MTTNPKHKLAELKAKAEAATPGPWRHYRDKLRPQFSGVINEVQPSRRKREGRTPPIVQWSGFDNAHVPESKHRANAAFIAACDPQTILDLISRVEASPAIPSGEQIELETTEESGDYRGTGGGE